MCPSAIWGPPFTPFANLERMTNATLYNLSPQDRPTPPGAGGMIRPNNWETSHDVMITPFSLSHDVRSMMQCRQMHQAYVPHKNHRNIAIEIRPHGNVTWGYHVSTLSPWFTKKEPKFAYFGAQELHPETIYACFQVAHLKIGISPEMPHTVTNMASI